MRNAMASVNSINIHEINIPNLEKIENFFNDSAYKEAIENSETFNTRLCIERRLRMPFLDPQTGVAQYHSSLFFRSRQRIPGLKEGQIYSYPSARWRKSRRQYLMQKPQPPFPVYTHRPFGHLQSSYDSENSNLDSTAAVASIIEPEAKDHKDDPGKEWYYDEMDMHEMESYDDHDLPDSDCDFEESYSNRKKKGKSSKGGSGSSKSKTSSINDSNPQKRGRTPGGRGRGRKSQGVGDSPTTPKDTGENVKKNRSQTLPHLTPQTSSSPLTVPSADEPSMPVLVPETKVPEEPEEVPPSVKPGMSAGGSNVSSNAASPVPPIEKGRAIPSPYCDFCLGDARENKKTLEPEELVSCSDCGRSGHPTCLQFTANMIISVRKYRWQCIECKYCTICGTSDNDDQLLFCDDCDRGYHMYCLSPPLISPPEGSWSCKLCTEEFHKKYCYPDYQTTPSCTSSPSTTPKTEWGNRKRRKTQKNENDFKAAAMDGLQRALKVMDNTDRYQIFGNYVASELRRLPDSSANRVQRKLARFLLDCVEEIEDEVDYEQQKEPIALQSEFNSNHPDINLNESEFEVEVLDETADTSD